MDMLIKNNKELQNIILEMSLNVQNCHSPEQVTVSTQYSSSFLQMLMNAANANSKKKKKQQYRYQNGVQIFASYIKMLGANLLHTMLHSSITIQR